MCECVAKRCGQGRPAARILFSFVLGIVSVACDPILGMSGTVRSAASAGDGSPVRGETSPPVPGATVTMRCNDQIVLQATSDADGRFSNGTAGMANETCVVRVEKPGFVTRETKLLDHCTSPDGKPAPRRPGPCSARLVIDLEPVPATAPVSSTPKEAPPSSPVQSAAPSASGAPPSFAQIAPLPPGAIATKGYPHNIRNGMNDVAYHVGFSSDSSLYAWCQTGGGRPMTRCELLARDGTTKKMEAVEGETDPSGRPIASEVAKKKEIDRFLAENKIPEIKPKDVMTAIPPPVTGTWTFTDITIDVARVAASGASPAHVKVGGSVAGEAPVHPITLKSNPVPAAPPHFAALNSLAISPDGSDIGMLGHFFACEYCDSFVTKRMPVKAFASLVYNDTGYRHHQKKAYARAAELFAKAVSADPDAKLPPYNLACAWARLGDPRAKDALAYAIERDPTARARAQTDKDFDSVRGEPWFPKAP